MNVDINVFTDEDFLPSSVTDDDGCFSNQNNSLNSSDPVVNTEDDVNSENSEDIDLGVEPLETDEFIDNIMQVDAGNTLNKIVSTVEIVSTTEVTPNTNCPKKIVTPEEIMPLPKCNAREVAQRRRKAQKSEILTSTPIKDELRAKAANKIKKPVASKGKRKEPVKRNLCLNKKDIPRLKGLNKTFGSHTNEADDFPCLVCDSSVSESKKQ